MNQYDVVVVGGGPGGSSLATFVAQAGHSVLLLEKETFPRHQIGESLLPATIQGICKLLGVKDEIDAASFAPKRGGTFRWGKSQKPWTFLFEREGKAVAYQVERYKFDDILLKNAMKWGVQVKESCRVVDLVKKNGRIAGLTYKDKEGQEVTVQSKYVVDASGHTSTIYQHVGSRIYSNFFRNSAIYGYFTGGKRLAAPNQGNILCSAFKYGWIWYIPLTPDLTSVGVVVDHQFFFNADSDKEKFFYDNIKLCPIVSDYLADAKRATGKHYADLRVRKDFSYTTTKLWTPGMALIGDAACFVDPLFSSGVHLATLSALFLARSINTSLKEKISETDCFNEFEKRYRKEYASFYNFLVAFYDAEQNEDDYYWAARKILNAKEPGNDAFIKLVSGYSTIEEIILDDNPENQDLSNFMTGFSEEIVNVQAQACGINLELLRPTSPLISTSDGLHWCEATTGLQAGELPFRVDHLKTQPAITREVVID